MFEPGELAARISASDSKAVQSIPGVGKKMADRIVLELKDKLEGLYVVSTDTAANAPSAPSGSSYAAEQVVEALVGLGFGEKVARPVVDKLAAENPDEATSTLLRAALTQLGKK